jgi:hypothetical protein
VDLLEEINDPAGRCLYRVVSTARGRITVGQLSEHDDKYHGVLFYYEADHWDRLAAASPEILAEYGRTTDPHGFIHDDIYELGDKCLDCHTDTGWCEAPDSEWFMVHNHVWLAAGMGMGKLCVGCIETRLGRRLTPEDFTDCNGNKLSKRHGSARLIHRMTETDN